MGGRILDKSMYLDVSTFDNLRDKAGETKSLCNAILENLMFPLQLPLEVNIQKTNGRKQNYVFSDKNWNKICSSLNNDFKALEWEYKSC